jgi:predicted ATP-dependent endonuclease of OLD family
MLTSISVKNFRLFQSLEIEDLNRVNLIAGLNNSGKTALLEALYFLFANYQQLSDFPIAFRNSQRGSTSPNTYYGDEYLNFWAWLPFQKEPSNLIEIRVSDKKQAQLLSYVLKQEPQSSNPISFQYVIERPIDPYNLKREGQGSLVVTSGNIAFDSNQRTWPRITLSSTKPSYPTEDAEQFSRLALKKGAKKRLVDLLRIVEPRLQNLEYLKPGSEALIYAELDLRELIPVTQLGQGFIRLLRFFSEMLISKSDIVLIDEIENGLHHSVLKEVWKGIAAMAREESIQIFATTHSWECIGAAHEAFTGSSPYDLRLHRLEKVKGKIQAITYDQESLDAALRFEMEVR